jgi:hypothetical protein
MRSPTSPLRARVRWLAPHAGGRAQPPSGPEYVAVARFDDPAGDWSSAAWSVVLRFLGSVEDAEVRFLVSEAPAELLRPGVSFEIYEGPRKVADVSVG